MKKGNGNPAARFQKRASKAMAALVKEMVYIARFSNGTRDEGENEIYVNYELKWKTGKFDTRKMNQMIIAVEHNSTAINIKQLHDDFMKKIYQLPRRWAIRIELHFSDVLNPDITHVRPVEMFPEEPLKLQYLQEVFNKEKDELVASININSKVRDLVWKFAEYEEGIGEILEDVA